MVQRSLPLDKDLLTKQHYLLVPACNILFSSAPLIERQSPQIEYVGPDISDAFFCPALSLQHSLGFFIYFFTVPPFK